MTQAAPMTADATEAVGAFFGLPPLSSTDLGSVALAATILIAVILLTRWLAKWLCAWLERSVAPKFTMAEHQRPPESRYFAAGLASIAAVALLTIAAEAHSWPAYPMLLSDLAIPFSAAAAAWGFAHAFKLSRSAAAAIAIVCGFVVLTRRFEQLAFVQRSLDGFAIRLGSTRISLLDLLSALFAGVVLYAVVRLAIQGAKALIRRRADFDLTQSLLAEKLAVIAISVVAILVAIDMLGIDTTALSVFSGTIGLGLGFGLQKIFSNLVSGIILLMDRSIKPGDVIVVGEAVGEVSKIGTRAVSVITRDGKEHLIPNELLMTERVENWNFSSRDVRIRMTLRIGYDSDVDLVETLLTDATRESPRVLNDPKPVVRIIDISNSGVALELRFWIRDPEDGLGNIQSEIYKRILPKFRENGITPPNEGRDLEIKSVPPITLVRDEQGDDDG